ncbi:MAG TPA: GTP 3',8-cyclase MoaA [Hadesarchaea archaeon]|nr:GTP 3',8-cyclase MoaA [Hadesarchaea archaeon]
MIRDRFGRPVTGLRISVTEKCNLDCFYCHREGCLESRREMTADEVGKVVEVSREFGVRKIKLTGGEPLLRDDIVDVVRAVAGAGIGEVSMTTNGVLLSGVAHELAEAGLDRVNISLDTLDPRTFHKITGNGSVSDVFAGIDAALDAGLSPVKLNMVLLAGLNDHEVESMIAYTSKRGIVLQIIELLDTDGRVFSTYHRDLDDIERGLRSQAAAVRTRCWMQARKKYILQGGEVEVVRPMHNSEFCMHCTRLRLTADGYLKPCLMRNDNLVDVLSLVKTDDLDEARKAFAEAIARREPYFKGVAREARISGRV